MRNNIGQLIAVIWIFSAAQIHCAAQRHAQSQYIRQKLSKPADSDTAF
jgi:hypothetical protein